MPKYVFTLESMLSEEERLEKAVAEFKGRKDDISKLYEFANRKNLLFHKLRDKIYPPPESMNV